VKLNILKALFVTGSFLTGATLGLNAQTTPQSEVGQRQENQQDRVAQGVKSGQMTPGETARVENRSAKINHEVKRDRAANGGTLTPAEKAKVNHQQNLNSRAIYNDKHNDVKQ